MRLSAIHVYPVKSCAGLSVESAVVEPRGLRGDRRFVIVDAQGRFITGRQFPATVRIHPELIAGGIRLQADGVEPIEVAVPEGNVERISVSIWKDTVEAAACDPAADAWLSRVLATDARLAYMDMLTERPVDPNYSRPGDEVSFADAYPMLLISDSALDHLNARLAQPIPMARFRPNLVIEGAPAHAEDDWTRIRIGNLELDLVKKCTRCVFTTVDPATGTFDPSGEPLDTLKTYRRSPKGITFGQNVIARSLGTVRVGDEVEILA